MAQPVVTFVVERLGDILIQEAVFLYGVEDKVLQLQSELRMMQSYLQDADRRQYENQTLRTYVSEIRETAYDSYDAIEAYVLRSGASRRDFTGALSRIKRYAQIIKQLIEIHQVGSQVDNIIGKITSLTRSLETYGIRCERGEASNSLHGRQRAFRRSYSHIIEEDIIGVEHDVKVLESCLTNPNSFRVVAICGMGGLGKTTLAKKLYHSTVVRHHFESLAWAYISQNCQARDVWEGILFKLIPPTKELREEIAGMRDEDLARKLYQVQVEKRCLVVLDDIWREDTWRDLGPGFFVFFVFHKWVDLVSFSSLMFPCPAEKFNNVLWTSFFL